jgi:hypothetical protein
MPKKKIKRRSYRASLLHRVERLARTAAALRLHGNIERAMTYDKKLDQLFNEADKVGIDVTEHEIKGRQRGDRLYHKIVRRRH